jgi:hypothetical protein
MKITTIFDIMKIQYNYSDDDIFIVIETGEEITITDLLYGYDGQSINIKQKEKGNDTRKI